MAMELRIEKLLRKAGDHYYKNKLLQAEYYCNLAYKLAIKDSKPLIISDIIHNKALFFFIRKTFSISIEYYKESIRLKSKIREPNNLANSLNGIGRVYRAIGDYQKALDSFKHSVEISIRNDNENLAAYLFDLARLQKVIKNFKESFVNYHKSIEVAQRWINESKSEISKFFEQIIYNCYNDLSEIELTKSNIQQAKYFHKQALQVLEHSNSDVSNFFEGYKRFEIPAKIFMTEEKYFEAIEQLERAKEAIIQEYQGFEVGKDLANIIHQIGNYYIHLNQNKEAIDAYQEAVKAVCIQFCCLNIESLPDIEDIYNKRSAIASLSYKASTWLLLYQTDQKQECLLNALKTYKLITKLLPLTRKDYVEENSKFQLAEETKGIFQKAIDTCFGLHQLTKEQKYHTLAFKFTESAKAIVLQEHIQANHAIKGVDEPIQQKDMDFRSKIAFYQNAINTNQTTNGDVDQVSKWQAELFKCKEQYE